MEINHLQESLFLCANTQMGILNHCWRNGGALGFKEVVMAEQFTPYMQDLLIDLYCFWRSPELIIFKLARINLVSREETITNAING